MSLRADSYSSLAEVTAFTRHLLDGESSFDITTRPTLAEVEKFIDRVSGVLNGAIAKAGFAPAAVLANSTAKLACDDWVTDRAVQLVELTQRGVGYSEADGSRVVSFAKLAPAADQYMQSLTLGFVRLGISQSHPLSEGLINAAETIQVDRGDRTDTTLEQPMFERHKFDNPRVSTYGLSDEEQKP